jgi:ATP-dependent exoDNAse (exonuclease V) beta subunit
MSSVTRPAPPDQQQREQALEAGRSILVQAPAGSGKTDLLTRRFLRLLCEVENPGQIVAITFTKAAAAEMRNRILSELEKASARPPQSQADDEFSMESLAQRALHRSRVLEWDLLRMPAQLRISTIDSFCRDLALQQPLLSGLGGGLDITENAEELYHRAARRTLEQIGNPDSDLARPALSPAIESLLLWRDNGWQEVEAQLAEMLKQRDRWMQEFVLTSQLDWDALREKLERPFARVVDRALRELDQLFDQETRDEAMDLARFSCGQKNKWLQCKLFQISGQPCQPFSGVEELEQARQGYLCLAEMLLTEKGKLCSPGAFHKGRGFPKESPEERLRILDLVRNLSSISGLESTLHAVRSLPPARYPEEDWQIVRACFILLRYAAAELQVAFADAGVVDFTEVAQLALRVLQDEDGLPSDAAQAVAESIHHLLIDEFQDTSRRQHKLISALVAAWPDSRGRSVFVVGDPMQSIYFFRDADAELFPRVRMLGLELPNGDRLPLDFVPLSSNFRTTPQLVCKLNETFAQIFAANDGSNIKFADAKAARDETGDAQRLHLHVEFVPQTVRLRANAPDVIRRKQEAAELRTAAHKKQTAGIISLIRSSLDRIELARARGEKFRIAVLGRTYRTLEPIAEALRNAAIPFRAVDLENLGDRPEVLDALALARALLNPEDRIAWLGVLRAPWAGLSLGDLHLLSGADDPALLRRPIPELLSSRINLLSDPGRQAAARLMQTLAGAHALRAAEPSMSLGTWLEQVWLRLGGADCVDAAGRANLDLSWRSIDKLENGEQDLLGGGLDAALADLKAQPDPSATSDHGVQLMTIHKAKGLEFEMVIVPDLQADCRRGESRLLSWLERGLESADESVDITEFLVAPLPSKGAESGKCKWWVDRERRNREAQEMRRILYVAATRAREELHLFARPEYKTEQNGSYTLCDPRESLLSTAWPAAATEIKCRFDQWTKAPEDFEIGVLAASGINNVIEMPRSSLPAIVRRLPADYIAPRTDSLWDRPDLPIESLGGPQLYERHEGGAISRALGSAVHFLFEELANLRAEQDWPAVPAELQARQPRVIAQLRAVGMNLQEAARISTQALEIATQTSYDPIGQWILSPHPAAASEAGWITVIDGVPRQVRADRIFRAGPSPEREGGDCWWIVDYKTAQENDSGNLRKLRTLFAPQVELYAQVLRNLHGKDASIRAGLYYPRMLVFDWWEL